MPVATEIEAARYLPGIQDTRPGSNRNVINRRGFDLTWPHDFLHPDQDLNIERLGGKRLHEKALRLFTRLHRPGEGIVAAGKGDIFEGAFFGRDSAIMAEQAIKAGIEYKKMGRKTDADKLFRMARDGLSFLFDWQATTDIPKIGAEVGKIPHEIRTQNYEHLKNGKIDGGDGPKPAYIDNGVMKLYDSVDVTALTLGAAYHYWEATGDYAFIYRYMPNIRAGLRWQLRNCGDDYLAKFAYPKNSPFFRSGIQGLGDSRQYLEQPYANDLFIDEAIMEAENKKRGFKFFRATGNGIRKLPDDPIALAEVQGQAWLAMTLWSQMFRSHPELVQQDPELADELEEKSNGLKQEFNSKFIVTSVNKDGERQTFIAQALDGQHKPIRTRTALPMANLWSARRNPMTGRMESIIDDRYIPEIVKSGLEDDLFDDRLGILTMSTSSPTYDGTTSSYHNGPSWSVINWEVWEGFRNFGYNSEADRIKKAALLPIKTTGKMVEQAVIDKDQSTNGKVVFAHYYEPRSGQACCSEQGWTAGAVLNMTLPSINTLL